MSGLEGIFITEITFGCSISINGGNNTINNYSIELQKKYMPFAIIDEKYNIIGFVANTPIDAKKIGKRKYLNEQKI